MNTKTLIGLGLRHGLGALGAIGLVSDSDLETIAGALALVAAVGWSIVEKRLRARLEPVSTPPLNR